MKTEQLDLAIGNSSVAKGCTCQCNGKGSSQHILATEVDASSDEVQ